jgi:hypothetical protein
LACGFCIEKWTYAKERSLFGKVASYSFKQTLEKLCMINLHGLSVEELIRWYGSEPHQKNLIMATDLF